jgi:2-polyprenyl-3-methyl-5-hydroxy-6-metoxy-1,4-benzoquinol methylase
MDSKAPQRSDPCADSRNQFHSDSNLANQPDEEHAWPGLHEWLTAQVSKLPGICSDTPILDLGCGTGSWLSQLAAAGYHDLTGVDSQNETRFAALGRINFVNGNLNDQDLMLGERKFGLITAIEVIEHLARPERLFDHALRYLGPNGWMIVTTPNIYSLRVRMRFFVEGEMLWFDKYANDHHIHPVLLRALKRVVLEPRALSIVEIRTYPETGANPLGRRWFARLLNRILARILPNALPGDALCLFIRREKASETQMARNTSRVHL